MVDFALQARLARFNAATTRFFVFDYETRSTADLEDVGAYEYARHPTTEIMCAAFRWGTRAELAQKPTRIWSNLLKNPQGGFGTLEWAQAWCEMINALQDPGTIFVAHNALFEQLITKYVLSRQLAKSCTIVRDLTPEDWLCTASLCSALALPRNLEGAAKAIKLKAQKDAEGRRLMLKLSKPAKQSKERPVGGWYEDPDEVHHLLQYCATDIDVEVPLFLRLPPLNATERQVWELDQRINQRGLRIDRPLVGRVLDFIAEETETLHGELFRLTDGKVERTSQRARVQAFFADHGLGLADMKKDTIESAIETNYMVDEPKAQRVLEIYAALSSTSVKKYPALLARSATDGRCRDILMYHGASTGRWTGLGIQPQNFPRSTLPQAVIDHAIATIAEPETDTELLRLLYGPLIKLFVNCIRGTIVPADGNEFFCADYSAIEARVLFWVADHLAGVKAFAAGSPIYEMMAAEIFSKPLLAVTKEDRELGKRAVLGCGYQMGWKKFQATCEAQARIRLPDELAEKAVRTYRRFHAPVPKLWSNLQRAAVAAVENPGKIYRINHTAWNVNNGFLWCQLPSGRRLAYAEPAVQYELPSWGGEERLPVLYHWGVDPTTHQWVRSGTYGGKLTENVVQAIARDLMAAAMLRIEQARWLLVLTVHDEILAERKRAEADLKEFERLMSIVPAWAAGCPVKVAGWKGNRYRK